MRPHMLDELMESVLSIVIDKQMTPRERLRTVMAPYQRSCGWQERCPPNLRRQLRALEDHLIVASLNDGADEIAHDRVCNLLIDLHSFVMEYRRAAVAGGTATRHRRMVGTKSIAGSRGVAKCESTV